MKSKAVIVLLLLTSLVLGGILIWENKNVGQERRDLTAQLTQFSNDWMRASSQLNAQKDVNREMESQLSARKQEIEAINASLAAEKSERAKIEAEAQKAAQIAQEEVAKRDARIAALETQVGEKTKQLDELTASITGLEQKIVATQAELDTTKGDKEFLLVELKRLQSEKSRLEQQFNDLQLLRDQVSRLKDELALNRRLEWMRKGIYGANTTAKGGASKMMHGFQPTTVQTNFDLNVELKLDGASQGTPSNPPK